MDLPALCSMGKYIHEVLSELPQRRLIRIGQCVRSRQQNVAWMHSRWESRNKLFSGVWRKLDQTQNHPHKQKNKKMLWNSMEEEWGAIKTTAAYLKNLCYHHNQTHRPRRGCSNPTRLAKRTVEAELKKDFDRLTKRSFCDKINHGITWCINCLLVTDVCFTASDVNQIYGK